MKLALLGDLHYPESDASNPKWNEARRTFYHHVVERFLDCDAELYISLGDLTNYGLTSELTEIYELLRKPGKTFIQVLGNHDLYGQTRHEVLRITGQQRYHVMDADEAVLVFLDTSKEMDYEDWGGWLQDDQLEWLEEQIVRSGSKPLLVFGHHPIHRTTAGSEIEKGSIHPTIDMWKILKQNKGTGIYFNGHTHRDSIVHQQEWSFVQLSSCLDQPGFRLVDIAEESIRITAVDIIDPIVMDSLPLLHKHMKHFTPTAGSRGEDHDRELTLHRPK